MGTIYCSKDSNRALGPKYCNINRIWALKPYYLGPWTPRVWKGVERGVGEQRAYGAQRGGDELHWILGAT